MRSPNLSLSLSLSLSFSLHFFCAEKTEVVRGVSIFPFLSFYLAVFDSQFDSSLLPLYIHRHPSWTLRTQFASSLYKPSLSISPCYFPLPCCLSYTASLSPSLPPSFTFFPFSFLYSTSISPDAIAPTPLLLSAVAPKVFPSRPKLQVGLSFLPLALVLLFLLFPFTILLSYKSSLSFSLSHCLLFRHVVGGVV